MIRKTVGAIAFMILALAAVSCQKDDTLAYNNMTMGNIVDGRFVSDQGNIFNIVDQRCTGSLGEVSRAMVLCDVLNATKGAENEYDIRLTSFAPVLTKDAVPQENAVEGEIAVEDNIHIEQLWFAGGYMNMLIKYPAKTGSTQKHLVNLVYSRDEDGKYVMTLRHNAFGEVWSEGEASQMLLAGAYVSFPVADLFAGDTASIVLGWKWYEAAGYDWNYHSEKEYSFEYNWKREGFIHSYSPQSEAE